MHQMSTVALSGSGFRYTRRSRGRLSIRCKWVQYSCGALLDAESRTVFEPSLVSPSIAIVFAALHAPFLLPVESISLHFQQCNTDRQPSVQLWIASPEKPNRFETDESAIGTTIRRLQRKEVLRRLLQDCAFQPVLFPGVETLAKKRPLLGRTSEPVGDCCSRNLIHTPDFHRPSVG